MKKFWNDEKDQETSYLEQSVDKKQDKKTIVVKTGLYKVVFVVIGMAVFLGIGIGDRLFGKDNTAQAENGKEDVTIITVESALSEIGELATSRWDYNDVAGFESTRQLFKKFSVPLTTNSVEIAYSGVIKAGYQLDDLDITVNNANRKIYVDIPDPQVLDNYIADESIEIIKEKNNIFNPVNQEYVMSQLTNEKNRQLEKALEEGLYQKAREEVEEQIGRKLAGLEYEVVFGNV